MLLVNRGHQSLQEVRHAWKSFKSADLWIDACRLTTAQCMNHIYWERSQENNLWKHSHSNVMTLPPAKKRTEKCGSNVFGLGLTWFKQLFFFLFDRARKQGGGAVVRATAAVPCCREGSPKERLLFEHNFWFFQNHLSKSQHLQWQKHSWTLREVCKSPYNHSLNRQHEQQQPPKHMLHRAGIKQGLFKAPRAEETWQYLAIHWNRVIRLEAIGFPMVRTWQCCWALFFLFQGLGRYYEWQPL